MNQIDPLLEAAVSHRLISKKQLSRVLKEMEASPGLTAEQILLEKHYLTHAQLENLLLEVPRSESAAREQAPEERASDAVSPPPAQQSSAPAPPPSQPAAAPAVETPAAANRTVAAPSDNMPHNLADLLALGRYWGASDVHVSVGRPPFFRLNGDLVYLEMEPLTEKQAEKFNFQMLTRKQREYLVRKLTLNFALNVEGLGRHRCNVFHQRRGWDGVYRIVPDRIPSLAELGLPSAVEKLTHYPQGMVLVTGPGRSGKSTTIAALLRNVNEQRDEHIITVEDPIEYVHNPIRCQITQRQIFDHSLSYDAALRAALREDPDIIMIGELRDLDSISIALTAAETGHLVFGSLHTGSASRTVNRIMDVYPPTQRSQVAIMFSESARGILSQQLVPRKDGEGLTLALEIMIVTDGIAALIRDGKTYQLNSSIQSGKRIGMQLMDDSLLKLANDGIISGPEAYRRADNKQPFEALKDAS